LKIWKIRGVGTVLKLGAKYLSTASTHGYERPLTTDRERQTENKENDPWMPMVEEAMQKYKPTFGRVG
jgi:hypothetical protein